MGEEMRFDIEKVNNAIKSNQIKVIQLTPSRLKLLLSVEISKDLFTDVEILLVGGEVFPFNLLQNLRKVYKGRIYNMYGPTETTIYSTFKDVSGEKALNIGKPIINTQIYILSDSLELQPVGVIGELCVGGSGVAKGYLFNEKLTNERFIENPFKKGERLYKTGDYARWLNDGCIEFIGRIDNQIKLRGYRIELGEIEDVLLNHEKIDEAIVIINGNNEKDKQLIAFIVVSDSSLSMLKLKSYLRKELPGYMVPSIIIPLDSMPLTPNGKTNKLELVALLDSFNTRGDDSYVEPKTEIEIKLAEVWMELLEIKKVGLNDTFFDLGGHSYILIKSNQEIKNIFNVDLSFNVYFNQTLEQISKEIEEKISELNPSK